MLTQSTLLVILGGVTLMSSLLVLLTTHPVYAVFFLLGTFLALSLFFLVAGLTFFGFIYLIIYAGAIAVIFLFIIMSLDLTVQNRSRVVGLRGWATLALLTCGLGTELVVLLGDSYVPLSLAWLTTATVTSSPFLVLASGVNFPLGVLVATLYTGAGSVLFLVCGFILLVAMVGAIALTWEQDAEPLGGVAVDGEAHAKSLYKEGYHNP